ncbi:MAG: pentapeptide repeat-containing protein [Leptolyngbya sp. SIO1D8]|nr:pentapeptide repeat-containing protein [Leptolyngbya sp. SIO1D8]
MSDLGSLTTPEAVVAAVSAGKTLSQHDFYQGNFAGLDLCQGVFSKAILVRANCRQTKLEAADLSYADLRAADLRQAVLTRAQLQGACLYRVDLRGADLRQADLADAQLQGALYDQQTLFPDGFAYKSSGAIGPGANLNGAALNTANLRQIDLEGANLLGAYLGGADLTQANLQKARLAQADLRRAILTGALLCNARINGINLTGVDLRAANLTDVAFEQFESIAGADFTLVQGLTPEMRSHLLSYPAEQLDTMHPLTRKTTRESLESIA